MTRAREQGFTLIEIVVSLGLACLILVGALGFLNAQSRSHRDSMELQTMQTGLRVALERVLRDARSASAGFAAGTVSIQDVTAANAGLVTLDAVSLGHTVGSNVSNSGLYGTGTGSDELNLIFADGRGVTNTTKDAGGTVNKQSTPQTITVLDIGGFTDVYPDNFVLVSNAANAILVQVDTNGVTPGVPAPTGTIKLKGMTTQPANVFPGGLANFAGGSMILTATAVTYRIDTSVFGTTEPALVMQKGGPLGISATSANPVPPDPLATQIEDLQVALGYDGLNAILPPDNLITAADKIHTEDTTGVNLDEWAFNVLGETQTGAIATLRALRVSLVSRSVTPRTIGRDVLTVEDHVPSATGARYLRRRLTGVASVRNLAL